MGGALTGRPSARRVVEIVGWSNTTPTSFMRPPHLSHLSNDTFVEGGDLASTERDERQVHAGVGYSAP